MADTLMRNTGALPERSTWTVRLLDGPVAGSMWPLSEEPLVIGRGLGCQVRLDDQRVSRSHCELLLGSEGPRIRNLSENNITLVNGEVRAEIALHPGDIIEVADFRLMVAPVSFTPSTGPAELNTTMSMSDALHVREEFDADLYGASPILTVDLHSLFHLLRTLSRADSLDILIGNLKGHVLKKLSAGKCWVGWRVQMDGEIALYPPVSPEETQRAPMDLMREACRLGQGLLPPLNVGDAQAMLAAPLIQGSLCFGAIVVGQDVSAGAYTKRHLNYLVSVAECAAPLIRATERLEQLRRDGRDHGPDAAGAKQMLGNSPALERVRGQLRRAALSKANVLICGETGVGKELAARWLHDLSLRASGPYVTVNCAAIPGELFESEIFGHERGAFTGATRQRKGLLELAHGGTLFLDEVGELTMQNQARLLRAVETGTFRRVGAEREIRVDVRIVSATNRPLPDGDSSYFREDLYHRLANIEITIPPLRERREDIPELAQHYVDEFSRHAPARPRSFSKEAMERLLAYDWPGNIRELRNTVERACFDAPREIITASEVALRAPSASANADIEGGLDAAERRHMVAVLEQCAWRVADAAAMLGLSKSTMYYKLTKHRIDVKRRKA